MNGDYASIGLVFYLFAIFSAYWAQETGRSTIVWFFLGLFFAPFTGLALLSKNSGVKSSGHPAGLTARL